MGDASLEEMAALGELVCYPSSTAEEARERVKDADVACLNIPPIPWPRRPGCIF